MLRKNSKQSPKSALDLRGLDPDTFEHLVNCLAVQVLGPGVLSFAKGADQGRDGYFEGECDYPSRTRGWSGSWYIQSKYRAASDRKGAGQWLLDQVRGELKDFGEPSRTWPNNWIVATNFDVSTTAFDRIKATVAAKRKPLAKHFHVWGLKTLSALLVNHPAVLNAFRHLLTPGEIVSRLLALLEEGNQTERAILRYLTAQLLVDQQHTKLDQAGSANDARPRVDQLFIDLPFYCAGMSTEGLTLKTLCKSAAAIHTKGHLLRQAACWEGLRKYPSNARIMFIRGGPGQGKSTVAQYFSQIHRAALLLATFESQHPDVQRLVTEIRESASAGGYWPHTPRLPIIVDLKDYAQWITEQKEFEAKGVVTYLAANWSGECEIKCTPQNVRSLLANHRCFIAFDGLDEVPTAAKDTVAREAKKLMNEVWFESGGDHLYVCTSRPQGYSGEFDDIDGAAIDLVFLDKDLAYQCAAPLLRLDRTAQEIATAEQTLKDALETKAVEELMRTPLQTHIMAIVVRDGGRPPERRWALFVNFYDVIRKREARNKSADKELVRLLQEETVLIKKVHDALGFVLQTRAEQATGSITTISRGDFERLVKILVSETSESRLDRTVAILMRATTDRLVLVNTPDNGDKLRFDVRQLQEFFAAEYLYEGVDIELFRKRFEVTAGDPHWQEVTHFVVSALVENRRKTEVIIAAKVLDQLNSAISYDDCCPNVASAVAAGALIALRLLQEGVLEQEKEMRLLFTEALKPIIGSYSQLVLGLMLDVRGQNSRRWLENFVLRELDGRPPERRAAGLVALIYLADENSELIETVKRRLFAADLIDLKTVLQSYFHWSTFLRGPGAPLWFILAVIDYLNSPRWRQDMEVAAKLVDFLRSGVVHRFLEATIPLGLIDSIVAILTHVFGNPISMRVERKHGVSVGIAEYGVHGFQFPKRIGENRFSGIFAIWSAILRAASESNHEAVIASLSEIDDPAAISLVLSPAAIAECFPFASGCESNYVDAVLELRRQIQSGVDIRALWGTRRTGRSVIHMHGTRSLTQEAFKYLLGLNADAALFELLMAFDESKRGGHGNRRWSGIVREAGRLIRENDEWLCFCMPLWNDFISLADEDERPIMRSSVVRASRKSFGSIDPWAGSFKLFPFDLSTESTLLPHAWWSVANSSEYVRRTSGLVAENVSEAMDRCRVFSGNINTLLAVYADNTADIYVRSSAGLIANLLQPGAPNDLGAMDVLITEAIRCDKTTCFTRTFAQWFGSVYSLENRWASEVMDSILAGLAGFHLQKVILQSIFERWREKGRAPVAKLLDRAVFGDSISRFFS